MARKTRPPISIGETEVHSGQRVTVDLPLARLYTATSLHMQVTVIHGRAEGPTVFICAAIHADELNGVEIIRQLLKKKLMKSLRGTLLAVPVVNVHGFIDRSRYLPDRRDLNRSFPGSARGSIASRVAHTFLNQVVAKADYGIDLHTGAIDRCNLPQEPVARERPATEELAEIFGAPVVIRSALREGSVRACADERNIPVLVYEAGEALRFDALGIRTGVRGIIRVLKHLGMLPRKRRQRSGLSVKPVLAQSTRWVRAPASGIVMPRVRLGERVSQKQLLATISDPMGDETESVRAPFSGIVIGRSQLPLAHEGDALMNLAAFESVERAETLVRHLNSSA